MTEPCGVTATVFRTSSILRVHGTIFQLKLHQYALQNGFPHFARHTGTLNDSDTKQPCDPPPPPLD